MRDPRNVVIAGLALACAFLLGAVVTRPAEPAWAQQAGGAGYGSSTVQGNRRFIAATGSVGSGMSVLWLIDTEARQLAVYGTSSMGKSVELRAARNIEWDLRLDDYHDDSQYKSEDLERLARRQKGQAPEKDAEPQAPSVPGQGPDGGGK